MTNSFKVAYITSSSYSGSTLLTFILNSHPEIGTISEYDEMDSIKDNPSFMCSCGEQLRKCEFFLDVKAKITADGIDFELDDMNLMFNPVHNEIINRYLTQKLPLLQSSRLESIRDKLLQLVPTYKNYIDKISSRNDSFMKAVTSIQSASVFLDANKNPYRIKMLSKSYNVTPVYLYKNGIAGAYSFHKKDLYMGKKGNFKKSCEKWFIEQITINRVLNDLNLPGRLDLSYSELCGNVNQSANKIFNTLGLAEHDVSNFNQSEHHIIGNAMRVTGLDKIKETTDWKDNLTEKNINDYREVYNKYIDELGSYNESIIENLWY